VPEDELAVARPSVTIVALHNNLNVENTKILMHTSMEIQESERIHAYVSIYASSRLSNYTLKPEPLCSPRDQPTLP
jgi:hypothetical protein